MNNVNRNRQRIGLLVLAAPLAAGLLLAAPNDPAAPFTPDLPGPTIFTAPREQLGLKLESQKGPVTILIIDHAERASEN
jgi:uncharacterized protein (TIGR03435 family)